MSGARAAAQRLVTALAVALPPATPALAGIPGGWAAMNPASGRSLDYCYVNFTPKQTLVTRQPAGEIDLAEVLEAFCDQWVAANTNAKQSAAWKPACLPQTQLPAGMDGADWAGFEVGGARVVSDRAGRVKAQGTPGAGGAQCGCKDSQDLRQVGLSSGAGGPARCYCAAGREYDAAAGACVKAKDERPPPQLPGSAREHAPARHPRTASHGA